MARKSLRNGSAQRTTRSNRFSPLHLGDGLPADGRLHHRTTSPTFSPYRPPQLRSGAISRPAVPATEHARSSTPGFLQGGDDLRRLDLVELRSVPQPSPYSRPSRPAHRFLDVVAMAGRIETTRGTPRAARGRAGRWHFPLVIPRRHSPWEGAVRTPRCCRKPEGSVPSRAGRAARPRSGSRIAPLRTGLVLAAEQYAADGPT